MMGIEEFERERIARELVMSMAEQGITMTEHNKEIGSRIFKELYLEWMYRYCPQAAILMDPMIMDMGRKMGLRRFRIR